MPLGLAALRNLAAAELAGTLHAIFPARSPRVIKASHDKPVVGRSFAVRWETRRAAQALLQAVQDGDNYESIVPATGTIRIPALSAGAISISLSLLPRRVTSDTEPTVYRFPLIFPIARPPRFTRLDVPPWITLGDELEVVWEAPAASGVEMFVSDGRQIVHETCHNAGVRRITTTHPGRWAVRLVAQGLRGSVAANRFVAVTDTGPRIGLNHRTIIGAPGSPAEFIWTITDARAAFLDLPSRHERHEIGLSGTLQTAIGHSQEEFRLTAISLDGRRRTVALATAPYAYPAFLSPE